MKSIYLTAIAFLLFIVIILLAVGLPVMARSESADMFARSNTGTFVADEMVSIPAGEFQMGCDSN